MTRHLGPLALLVSLLAPAVAGQSTAFGSGCSGFQPPAQLSFSGSTTVGATGHMQLTDAPPGAPLVLIVGTSNTQLFDGTLLPLDLSFISGVNPGCELLVGPSLFYTFQADPLGELDFGFKIPQGLGTDVYFQWAVIEDDSPLSITLTNGLHLHLSKTALPSPSQLDFGSVAFGEDTATQTLTVLNATDKPVTITAAVLFDAAASEYDLSFAPGQAPPKTLPPGGQMGIAVTFQPQSMGLMTAGLQIVHAGLPLGFSNPEVSLRGVGLGPAGGELLVDVGAGDFVDDLRQFWAGDFGGVGGTTSSSTDPVAGTTDDELYQTWRQGSSFSYLFGLPSATYELRLHFADLTVGTPGARVFDVSVEGALAIDNLDLVATAGTDKAHVVTLTQPVTDGSLALQFTGVTGLALVSAIEIRSLNPELEISPAAMNFGTLAQGIQGQQMLTLENTGTGAAHITDVGFIVGPGGGAGHEFTLTLGGVDYTGGEDDLVLPADFTLAGGSSVQATVTFEPTEHLVNDVALELGGNFAPVAVALTGTGGSDGSPFLHVVIEPIPLMVDYDGNASENVPLDGSFSHTHEPGQELVDFSWTEGAIEVSDQISDIERFFIGPHTVCLTITDDKVPAESLTDCVSFQVYSPSSVPGVVAEYFQAPTGVLPQALLDALPAHADFAEHVELFHVDAAAGAIGGSPFSETVMLRLAGAVDLTASGSYTFQAVGGVDRRLYVDGAAVSGPLVLTSGRHDIEGRFALVSTADLPAEVLMGQGAAIPVEILPAALTHDANDFEPVINSMPTQGITLGGNLIVIEGFGFFPADDVVVHWGDLDILPGVLVSNTPDKLELFSPAHAAGTIQVTVETPHGSSNAESFEYGLELTPPIAFDMTVPVADISQPTSGDWGPDGRFYVARRSGEIVAITFDENYVATDIDTYTGVKDLDNDEILGLAFDPFDPPSPVKVYVAHGELYALGGGAFTGPAPYPGQVSVLTGPNFNTPVPFITGLPVSNHDHSINSLQFDNNGDLLICSGGNTNAGIKDPKIGDVPESPFSAAIIKALTSKPDFNGTIVYLKTADGTPSADQVDGEIVDPAPDVDVEVHAPGMRNTFDLVVTTSRRLYATDNGPNNSFGDKSLTATTQGSDPAGPDEILLVEKDNYYGSAHRGRGRYDDRQNTYRHSSDASIPGVYSTPLLTVSSSTNGIAEYRATTFLSQMRGQLLVQRWNGVIKRLLLAPDGRSILSQSDVANLSSLDVQTGPGGAILGIDYTTGEISVLQPNDISATQLTAFDITPWRATSNGGALFVIGGVQFGTLADTSVTIGGIPATLTAVSSKRIQGVVPANPFPGTGLLDVVVTRTSQQSTISKGFRYLFPAPGLEPGWWEDGSDCNLSLGEVAAGVINGVLYLVGQGSNQTASLNIATGAWVNKASRPIFGHHHAAEVVGAKLYLLGGAGASAGKVQIYDPATNTWGLGADMPWAGASVNTGAIGGKIYAAGGAVGNSSVQNCAVYDPVANTWTAKAPMPVGRNHAACGSDGSRLWIFGGRDRGITTIVNGFPDVMAYDPVTNTWDWSEDPGSDLVPMPIGRGGMGHAPFWQGEFYVIGGETLNGEGATPDDVYDRVDVYDPATNAWREEADMPTARHGIWPVLYQGRIFVVGGGTQSGDGGSTVTETFTRQ